MAVSCFMYGNFIKNILSGKHFDWINNPIKVMLCSNSYTPDIAEHQFKSDVMGEVSGQGYITGGKILNNKTCFYDSVNNTVILDADDIVWENSTITARYAVLYDDSAETDAQKLLIGFVDFGEERSSSNGDFKIVWNVNGLISIRVNLR